MSAGLPVEQGPPRRVGELEGARARRGDRLDADPTDGRIERAEHGGPVGTLEGAVNLVGKVVPRPTLDEQRRGILEAERYLFSLGITAWRGGDRRRLRGDTRLVRRFRLTLGSRRADGPGGRRTVVRAGQGEEQIDGLLARRERARNGRFGATTVKIMQDGIVENFTAAMLVPYLDGNGHSTQSTGLSYFRPRC